ncbi:MFS transporter [Brevibacillus borstelensis]|uniref:MFS transporter n=1 Tax=Brevibacillus borstelensis TaxID=45462 RepID=UPI0030C06F9A
MSNPNMDYKSDLQVHPNRWYALAVILLPTLLVSLNTYMIQVALPIIQGSLHASFSEAQLILSAYSLALAVTLIVAGKLGDLYGRKRMLFFGVALFTSMALIGGVAIEPALLICIRIVQGLSAALIQPQVLSIMQVSYLPREKPLVFGIYGAVVGIAFTFGLLLGGFLVQLNLFEFGWRSIFFFQIPIGILVLVFLPLIPESHGERREKSVDWSGAALLTTGLFLFIYPLTEGQKQGWPLWTWCCLLAAFPVLLCFLLVEVRKQKLGEFPLVDLSIFKNRPIVVGMMTVIVVYLNMFSFFFVLSYYSQFGLHDSVQSTSMAFLPVGIGCLFTSLISPRLFKRRGHLVLKTGALLMGICNLLLVISLNHGEVHLDQAQNQWFLLAYGCGLGMATTQLIGTVLSLIPAKIAGTGSGLLTTFTYLANSLAVTLIGILFSSSLGTSLAEADLPDYVRAFSTALVVCSLLAFAAFICLCFLPGQNNTKDRGISTKMKN